MSLEKYITKYDTKTYTLPELCKVNYSNEPIQKFINVIEKYYITLHNFINLTDRINLIVPVQSEYEFKVFNNNIHSYATKLRRDKNIMRRIKTKRLNDLYYLISIYTEY